MTTHIKPSPRSAIALLAAACALSLAFVQVPALRGADLATLQPLADKAPALPVTTAFEKGPAGDNGPYSLKVTNTSKEALKVTTKILLSVAFHADNKARNLPEHTIEAGQTWTITDLAAADRVAISAKGFATLELVVP